MIRSRPTLSKFSNPSLRLFPSFALLFLQLLPENGQDASRFTIASQCFNDVYRMENFHLKWQRLPDYRHNDLRLVTLEWAGSGVTCFQIIEFVVTPLPIDLPPP